MRTFTRELITLVLLLVSVEFAAKAQQMTYKNMRDGKGITVSLSLPDVTYQSVNYKGEDMKEISLQGSIIPNDEGMPNLPRISRYIAIPQGSTVEMTMKDSTIEVVDNINLAPALEIRPTTEQPATDYVKDMSIYGKNEFYPTNPVEISPITLVRGVDAVICGITPFKYNPVTKQLVVYKNIEISIVFNGGNGHYGMDKYRSRWFDPILQNVFLNYDALPKVDYAERYKNYSRDGEIGCEYLIVIPNREDFRPYANQIKNFRTKQGIITKVMTLSEMGCTSTSQMKTFFHNAYNTWDIPPVAVLMMGDHNTNMAFGIPAESVSHPYSGTCISDNQYADVTGDHLPEMAFVRMTAENTTQLNVMVSKVIDYETNPCMDSSYYQHPVTALGWQTERWFQICNETIGGYWRNHGKNPTRVNAIVDGTPGSEWSSAQNTSTVVNYFGPSGLNYIPVSPSTLGGWYGGTASGVTNALNAGGFMLFHSDHGYEQGWGTPTFSNSDLNQLTNVGKLTYVIDNDCSTGEFDYSSPCFGEAFHRYTYNNQNAGAVGILCPTQVSYSFVNDVYFWGLFDLFDPQFLPDYGPYAAHSGNWLPAFGNIAGKYFLAQSSWPYNSDDKDITYQIYEHHSDAFLRLFTEVPQALAVDHTSEIMVEVPYIITCTQGATMAFTKGDEVLAVVEATGEEQEINLPEFDVDDTITLVCTKQNYLRYETSLLAIPANGPYIVSRGRIVNDNNNDGILEYDETATIDCKIKNVGIETSHNTVITLSSIDPYLTVIDSVIECGDILPDSIYTIQNAFTVKVNANVPDDYTILCNLTFTNGTNIWYGKFDLQAYAPSLELASFGIEGQLIPGQTVNVVPTVRNNGHAATYNTFASYSTSNPYVTVNTTTPVSMDTIDGHGSTAFASFSITLSEDIPFGTDILSSLNIVADREYSKSLELAPYVDICNVAITTYPYQEGYETGEIPQCWTQESIIGNDIWTVKKGGYNNHPYNAHTGVNNAFIHGESSTTKLITPTMDLSNALSATLTFWHAQSVANSNQDKLRVYYKNTTDGDWYLLAEYQFSIATWKQRTIELPNLSSNYYVAFEAECNNGFGVVLDDIDITVVPSSSVVGDANGDGVVNIEDVMTVTNYIITGYADPFFFNAADVNNDGMINVKDILGIINIIY